MSGWRRSHSPLAFLTNDWGVAFIILHSTWILNMKMVHYFSCCWSHNIMIHYILSSYRWDRFALWLVYIWDLYYHLMLSDMAACITATLRSRLCIDYDYVMLIDYSALLLFFSFWVPPLFPSTTHFHFHSVHLLIWGWITHPLLKTIRGKFDGIKTASREPPQMGGGVKPIYCH